jgi:hypothetical protein
MIGEVVFNIDDESVLGAVAAEVQEILAGHPLYPELG